MSTAGPGLRRPHTSALYPPLNDPPGRGHGERFVHVIGTRVFVDDRPADDGWRRHVVGVVGDLLWWAVEVPDGVEDPSYGAAVDLYGYFGRSSQAEWFAAGRAVQLVEWVRTHRFCGRCATPTEPDAVHRAMRCPACGLLAYPRVAPAMITLVTRGDGDDEEALLARGVNFPLPMYSCLAGFVEPGEDLEGAVAREVHEEVGLDVGEVSYRGSQPWPFPHSLMVGFRARYASGDLVIDETEIADAAWFRRDDLPQIPPGISIARNLIDEWLES